MKDSNDRTARQRFIDGTVATFIAAEMDDTLISAVCTNERLTIMVREARPLMLMRVARALLDQARNSLEDVAKSDKALHKVISGALAKLPNQATDETGTNPS